MQEVSFEEAWKNPGQRPALSSRRLPVCPRGAGPYPEDHRQRHPRPHPPRHGAGIAGRHPRVCAATIRADGQDRARGMGCSLLRGLRRDRLQHDRGGLAGEDRARTAARTSRTATTSTRRSANRSCPTASEPSRRPRPSPRSRRRPNLSRATGCPSIHPARPPSPPSRRASS